MNQKAAFLDTLVLASNRGFEGGRENTSIGHLRSMYARIMEGQQPFSEAKLGRWLGYAQGVLVAQGVLTLDECKKINRQHASGGGGRGNDRD